MKIVIVLLATASAAFAQFSGPITVVGEDQSRCEGRVPAFFMQENVELATSSSVDIENVSERQCLNMCTDNKDNQGRALICAAITYDKRASICSIYRVKAIPDGALPTRSTFGKRYFEKFCLPKAAPLRCGEAIFRRAEQKVLVGLATNVSREATLADCVRKCLEEPTFTCKSALYFFEDNECITNRGAASEKPDAFLDEMVDQVIYFDNGCVEDLPSVEIGEETNALVVANEQEETEKPQPIAETTTRAATTTTTTAATTSTTTAVTTTVDPDYAHRPGYSQWSKWSPCDRPDGRRIRRRECQVRSLCGAPLLHVQWCAEIDARWLTTVAPTAATTTTTAATTTAAATTTTTTIADATEEPVPPEQAGWGPWRARCQKFVTAQPCENGQEIGFQTRSCTGNPFQCQGTFFRYCTLSC